MKKKCKTCGSENIFKWFFCHECYKEKCKQYNRKKDETAPERKCKQCGKLFKRYYKGVGFCSRQCNYQNVIDTKKRKEEKNPAFRNGFYTKEFKNKNKSTTHQHLSACRRYRTNFRKVNGYDFCEYCGVNNSLKFETHHIIFASEKPQHPELHNFKNLIYLCINCHNKFHTQKNLRDKLIQERNLDLLFK